MPDTDLGWTARVVAVCAATRPGVFQRIDDCAERAGVIRPT
jgi:hypothetical protein